jgi:hypothetical protein
MRINPTNKFFWEKCNTTLLTQIVEVNSKKVSWTSKNLSSNPCSISNGLCHMYVGWSSREAGLERTFQYRSRNYYIISSLHVLEQLSPESFS